ncbi:MAG: NAD(P)H-hydrate dehydratase [Bacteroidales bacterium]|nr:NAD(P)H-hydrate dehydratase [Bacteroidales bacterium]
MKKILTSQQTRNLDMMTMKAQGISSYELMERAVLALFGEMKSIVPDVSEKNFLVVAGTGNNGGDGLGLARMLKKENANVSVWFCDFSEKISDECSKNLYNICEMDSECVTMLSKVNFEKLSISNDTIVVDAIFGTGLSRSVSGKYAEIIGIVNKSKAKVWSIDIPSGLFGEDNLANDGAIVEASQTFAIGNLPLSAMFAENYRYYGKLHLVDIGHDAESKETMPSDFDIIEKSDIVNLLKVRHPFDHKGTFGHALLIAGSRGKAGAAIMASRACLRSGVGLLSVSSPDDILEIMQISVPEAMFLENWDGKANNFTAFGVGPGIGVGDSSKNLVNKAFDCGKPCVLDADALNIIAKDKSRLNMVHNCILTPHPKEFERLFGTFSSSVERLKYMSAFSVKHNSVIVLKGGVTAISLSDGHILFYIGMNPGIATGGSGDVLTGVITSMLAQGYTLDNAAIAGVWMHGEAGKLASSDFGMISTIATDIICKLPLVTKDLTMDD